jgi:hypothetical protein
MRTYPDRRPPRVFTKFPDHPVTILNAEEAAQASNPLSDVRHKARKQAERIFSRNPDVLYVSVCDKVLILLLSHCRLQRPRLQASQFHNFRRLKVFGMDRPVPQLRRIRRCIFVRGKLAA